MAGAEHHEPIRPHASQLFSSKRHAVLADMALEVQHLWSPSGQPTRVACTRSTHQGVKSGGGVISGSELRPWKGSD